MKKSVALVIETENLKGGGERRDEVVSLERLLQHLRAQSFGLERLHELVVSHEGMGDGHMARLEQAAGRRITFVRVPEDAGYYGSKDAGYDATTADLVVFADADCWPDARWLEELTAPLMNGTAQVAAGRTAYRDDALGAALTTIDFMYFADDAPRTLGTGDSGRGTRNFYANNVAFERGVFDRFGFGKDGGFYRGNCQVLGLRLRDEGVRIVYVHEALTTHRLPDTAREAMRLRMLRGADAVVLAPEIARRVVPQQLKPLTRVPGLVAASVLGGRLLFSLSSINRQGLSPSRGVERAAVAAMVTAASVADALGAAGRVLGVTRRPERIALSYHANADRLSA